MPSSRMTGMVDEGLLTEGKALLDQNRVSHIDVLVYREKLVKQLELVDDYLVDLAMTIQKAVAGPEVVSPKPSRSEPGVRERREPNKMRNGEITDTWRIWDVLKRHGKPMTRAALIPITDKMNIKNPESALYSLRISGHIKREGGQIVLVDG